MTYNPDKTHQTQYAHADTLETINRYLEEAIDPYVITPQGDGSKILNINPVYSEELARDLSKAGITVTSDSVRRRGDLSVREEVGTVMAVMRGLGYVCVEGVRRKEGVDKS